jgi:hypothetical protein
MRPLIGSVRRLAGSGRVANVGPSFGGAGARTVALYALWGAVAFSTGYLVIWVGVAPWLGEVKFNLVQKYPWLDQKDPEEMD